MTRFARTALAAALVLAGGAHAASISLSPAERTVAPGETASFELRMDFDPVTPTVGGGIDFALSGPLTFLGFTPAAYFNAADPAFSGHGREHADGAYEVHLGSFAGLSGSHALGTIAVRLEAPGSGRIDVAANGYWGTFYSAGSGAPMDVGFTGATVTAVPESAALALMLAGLGAVGAAVRRRGRG